MTPKELADFGFRLADKLAAEAETHHWKHPTHDECMIDSARFRDEAHKILEALDSPGVAEKMSDVFALATVPSDDDYKAFHDLRRLLSAATASA